MLATFFKTKPTCKNKTLASSVIINRSNNDSAPSSSCNGRRNGQRNYVTNAIKTHNKNKIFVSTSLNPFYNLAFEDWMFRNENFEEKNVLFLWRNDRSVVIGRNQNPWTECAMVRMRDEKVRLVRRNSGGGTVYHDLGNLNCTFFTPREAHQKYKFTNLLTCGINKLGLNVPATVSERNDIMLGPYKISGSAYKISGKSTYHHCTLLIEAGLSDVRNYLNAPLMGITTKGVDSVRSPTTNIRTQKPELSYEQIVNQVIEEFCGFYNGETELKTIDPSSKEWEQVHKHALELQSWEWIYGRTPKFTRALQKTFWWGKIDLHLEIERGYITVADFESEIDLLVPLLSKCSEILVGKKYGCDPVKTLIMNDPIIASLSPNTEHCKIDYKNDLTNWFDTFLNVVVI